MEYVVDIQGFKNTCNEFIFKEVAIIAVQEDASPSVLLFQPPYSWGILPRWRKCENRWLEHNYLGISWNDGEIPYEDLEHALRNLLRGASSILVKGPEKKRWLEKIVPHVFDLGEMGCPSLKKMRKKSYATCYNHRLCEKPVCAAESACALKTWVLGQKAKISEGFDEVG